MLHSEHVQREELTILQETSRASKFTAVMHNICFTTTHSEDTLAAEVAGAFKRFAKYMD